MTTAIERGEATATRADRFSRFCAEVEPGLHRSLIAAYGSEVAANALA